MNFKLANLKSDYNILLKVKEEAENILKNIKEYPKLEKLLNDSTNLD